MYRTTIRHGQFYEYGQGQRAAERVLTSGAAPDVFYKRDFVEIVWTDDLVLVLPIEGLGSIEVRDMGSVGAVVEAPRHDEAQEVVRARIEREAPF